MAGSDADAVRQFLKMPGILGLVFGGFLAFVTSLDQELVDKAPLVPRRVSLSQLVAERSRTNHHVQVTGLKVSSRYAVRTRGKILRTGVTFELVPAGATGKGDAIVAVAHFGKPLSEADISAILKSRELTGLVLNGLHFTHKPAGSTGNLETLAKSRPGTDRKSVLRIDADPDFPNPSWMWWRWAVAYLSLGVGLTCLAVVLFGGEDDDSE